MEKGYGFSYKLRKLSDVLSYEEIVNSIIEKSKKTESIGSIIPMLEEEYGLHWIPSDSQYEFGEEEEEDNDDY